MQPYQKALHKSGYNSKLQYETNMKKPKKRNRQRKITWYNPPFSANVATNIGQKFFSIVTTCFPKKHPLQAIFNRQTLKLSYSVMPNMKTIIDGSNKTLNKTSTLKKEDNEKSCNCRQKNNCPLEGKCRAKNVIYQATVSNNTNNHVATYIGLCSTEFKTRYSNHKASFNHKNKQHHTELSKHIWKLKENNSTYNITWKILAQAQPYTNKTKRCKLCLLEKYFIICKPHLGTLNKRNELTSNCRHARSYLLGYT